MAVATLASEKPATKKLSLCLPLNRVEGDLEIRVELDGGCVSEAWSCGTMYRGFERVLAGRQALDALVLTPRICGICGTSHLISAAKALEAVVPASPPADAIRIRNLALMTEHVQSDIRHGLLMFMADFANPAYRNCGLFDEAVRRYEPFKGESVIEAIKETKHILEIIAIIGGQWPHSSYVVPGGVVGRLELDDLMECRHLLTRCRAWYERRILGCTFERWRQVQCAADLKTWLAESSDHRDSDLGFYIRFCRENGLDTLGLGHGNFLSFGSLEIPADSQVRAWRNDTDQLVAAGFARGTCVEAFDQREVTEHVAHSWYVDYPDGKHPFESQTEPYACGGEDKKYSWVKAPRYAGAPAETGPLAEMVVSGNPLVLDLIEHEGPNVFVRELARLTRPAVMLPAMQQWLDELRPDGSYYVHPPDLEEGQGFGLINAPRGALGHWTNIEDGKIKNYQVITPTAWNGSPRDSDGVRGPWEEALIGTPVRDHDNPIEVGHVVRSFDPCLVCAVHAVQGPKSLFRKKI